MEGEKKGRRTETNHTADPIVCKIEAEQDPPHNVIS